MKAQMFLVAWAATWAACGAAAPLKVAVYADAGASGIGAVEWCRMVHASPEMSLELVDGEGVRQGRLAGLDLLVMPGGNHNKEFASLGQEGVERTKDFIRDGGAYLGTCAGGCLLTEGENRLGILPWKSRGNEFDLMFLNFTVNEAGARALGIAPGDYRMRYNSGPFWWPTGRHVEGAKFEVWATVNSQATCKGQVDLSKGMYGAAAIVGGTYGKGRIFATSAHPEYFASTRCIVVAAIRYLTGREVTFPEPQRKPGAVSVGYYSKGVSGIDAAKTALALSDDERVDFLPIDAQGLWEGRLHHVDVLVVPGAVAADDTAAIASFAGFSKRGGRIATIGRGNSNDIPGAVRFASREDLVRFILAR